MREEGELPVMRRRGVFARASRPGVLAIAIAAMGCSLVSLDGLSSGDGAHDPFDGSRLDAPVADARSSNGPPSCRTLPATCGDTGNVDCCKASLVPGGFFNRLNDPAAPASVSPFRLDLFEVTVGRFRAYVDVLSPTEREVARAGLLCAAGSWTDAPASNETLPITCVVRKDAIAFCAWDGARLVSEAEWNFAAAGGGEQRYFPWSSPPSSKTITPSHAVSGGKVLPVGSRPIGVGRWGHFDLSGNAYEIVLDLDGPLPVPCVDCVNDAGVANRLMHRGGGPFDPGDGGFAFSTVFREGDPDTPSGTQGFRCARPL